MLFTIYLPRLAGPCQHWLAGGGRAAAEPPCPGHSHSDTDGDRTPQAVCVVGTEAGGHELAQQPGSAPCKPPPKAKPFFFVFLAATGSCSAPCPTLAWWGLTSHSMQPPGAAPPHRPRSKHHVCSVQEQGPIHASASYLGHELPWPHHPMPVPNTFGVQPGTPRGALVYPTPSSCAVFLPVPSSSHCLGARVVTVTFCRLSTSQGHPWHGPRCHSMVAMHPHPTQGKSIALATQAPTSTDAA